MQLSDFDYHLPEDLIAQTPLAERGASRLLLVDPQADRYADYQFGDLDLVSLAADGASRAKAAQ